MAKFKIQQLTGVIPAMQTIFDANEDIDEKAMRALVDFLVEKRIGGLYLTGSTGEGLLMSDEERMRVVDIICDQVRGRVPIMVHVGAISTKRSIGLSKHAYAAGADAIASIPPFYYLSLIHI